MKLLFPLFVTVSVCAEDIFRNPMEGYTTGDRFFYFPGDDGVLSLIDVTEPVEINFIEYYTSNPGNNGYWLYTRTNREEEQVLVYNNVKSVINSNHDPSKVTVFLAHGWGGDGNSAMNKLLTEAFLFNDDVNVIVLDWSRLAKKNYLTAKYATAGVGKTLGQFINWFVQKKFASYDRIHIVGFSLGGHLVGNAGRETGSAVARVTALDPARQLWTDDNNRVRASDAQYVEVIHTSISFIGYGISDPCGNADFYPNGGAGMPGCGFFSKWRRPSCSHSQAYKYMANTVKYNNLLSNRCSSYDDAMDNTCTGDLNPMGNSDLYKPKRGIFRVNTKENYSF